MSYRLFSPILLTVLSFSPVMAWGQEQPIPSHPPVFPGAARPWVQQVRMEQPESPLQTQLQRIQHLRRAAENLKAAGFEREAEEVLNQARKMERELPQPADQASPADSVIELRKLRESLNGLRDEVAALTRELQRLQPAPEPTVAPPAPAGIPPLPEISDEELDAPSVPVPYHPAEFSQAPRRQTTPSGNPTDLNLQFELVPVPTPAPQEPSQAPTSEREQPAGE